MVKYGTQKMLAKLGYTFEGSDLQPEEVQAFTLISNEIAKWRESEMKRKSRKGRK